MRIQIFPSRYLLPYELLETKKGDPSIINTVHSWIYEAKLGYSKQAKVKVKKRKNGFVLNHHSKGELELETAEYDLVAEHISRDEYYEAGLVAAAAITNRHLSDSDLDRIIEPMYVDNIGRKGMYIHGLIEGIRAWRSKIPRENRERLIQELNNLELKMAERIQKEEDEFSKTIDAQVLIEVYRLQKLLSRKRRDMRIDLSIIPQNSPQYKMLKAYTEPTKENMLKALPYLMEIEDQKEIMELIESVELSEEEIEGYAKHLEKIEPQSAGHVWNYLWKTSGDWEYFKNAVECYLESGAVHSAIEIAKNSKEIKYIEDAYDRIRPVLGSESMKEFAWALLEKTGKTRWAKELLDISGPEAVIKVAYVLGPEKTYKAIEQIKGDKEYKETLKGLVKLYEKGMELKEFTKWIDKRLKRHEFDAIFLVLKSVRLDNETASKIKSVFDRYEEELKEHGGQELYDQLLGNNHRYFVIRQMLSRMGE